MDEMAESMRFSENGNKLFNSEPMDGMAESVRFSESCNKLFNSEPMDGMAKLVRFSDIKLQQVAKNMQC
ncbi:hypothetical protein SLE2022_050030 [Rubroshorea leprosula]